MVMAAPDLAMAMVSVDADANAYWADVDASSDFGAGRARAHEGKREHGCYQGFHGGLQEGWFAAEPEPRSALNAAVSD